MENPEEILHSLEEFAKMKPKDIPRELEEYLKFVAKTGDPIYQWPAIKSLFREKFINVITEFHESCSSVEIPPCPNVEMFNYDLMKSFILEKIDTFSSAPFTLQRISELLTSPRKEYSRIDKYMMALEKNILVVSTMEPGSRRTENGESIMNGIESDHEHVPEPGNEINVEEMDDSPYIQTTNHVSEGISFDNTENGTHIEIESGTFTSEKINSEASTSSQEIVCVQYVSIEPVTGTEGQNLIDDTKEADVSVTITAVNIKNDNQDKPQLGEHDNQQEESLLIENSSDTGSEALTENIKKSVFETEPDVSMEITPVQSTNEADTIEPTEPSPPYALSEATPSTTVPDELSEELQHTQIISESDVFLENRDSENISPEDSVTSSDNSPCEAGNETNISMEALASNSSTDIFDNSMSMQEEYLNSGKGMPDIVDSTTKATGENNVEAEIFKINEIQTSTNSSEIPLESDGNCAAEILGIQSTEGQDIDSSNVKNLMNKTDVLCLEETEELIKTDVANEISKETPSKVQEPTESKDEEAFSRFEEKERTMEVDVVPERALDTNLEEKMPIEQPEILNSSENP